MTGILMLESLTRGNTLKQGDKTPLTYKLLDADGDNLNVAGKPATVRLAHPNYLTIGYEKSGLIVSQDDTVTFTIDKIIPSRKYNVEIIVDDKFVFPSRSSESKFTIDRSTLGTESNIIEIIGVDAVVRKAVDLINKDPNLIIDEDKLVNDLIANTGIKNIEEYYQTYSDVIKELSKDKDYHSLPEIAGARGGFDTLGARLDDTNAQLAQRVSKGNVNINDFDEETRTTFLEAQGIEVNYVLGLDNVKPENTTFFKPRKNLFNKDNATLNVDLLQGELLPSESYAVSEFVPVKPNTEYVANYTSNVAHYDNELNFITNTNRLAGQPFTSPNNSRYIRFTVGLIRIDGFQMEEGTVVTPYESYEKGDFLTANTKVTESNLSRELKEKVDNIKVLEEEVNDNRHKIDSYDFLENHTHRSKNIINLENLLLGHGFDGVGGIKESANQDTTDFLPVKPNTTYIPNKTMNIGHYNKDKEFIGVTNRAAGNTFKTFNDTVYLRVAMVKSLVPEAQIEEGNQVTPYEPYGDRLIFPDQSHVTDTIKVLEEEINDNRNKIESYDFLENHTHRSKNIINVENRLLGHQMLGSGEIVEHETMDVTDFLPIKPNTTYIPNKTMNIAHFNKDKEFISTTNRLGGNTFETFSDTAYIRVTMFKSLVPEAQIEEGDQVSPYDPYGARLIFPNQSLGTEQTKNIPETNLNIAMTGSSITWGTGLLHDSYVGVVDDYIRNQLADTILYDEVEVSGDSSNIYNAKLYKKNAKKITGVDSKIKFSLSGNELSIVQAKERSNEGASIMALYVDGELYDEFSNYNETDIGSESLTFQGNGTDIRFPLGRAFTYNHEVRKNGTLLNGGMNTFSTGATVQEDYLIIRRLSETGKEVHHYLWLKEAPTSSDTITVSFDYGENITYSKTTLGERGEGLSTGTESTYGDGTTSFDPARPSAVSSGLDFRKVDKRAVKTWKFEKSKVREFEIRIKELDPRSTGTPYFIFNFATNRMHYLMNAGIGGYSASKLLNNEELTGIENLMEDIPDVVFFESGTNDDWGAGKFVATKEITMTEEELRTTTTVWLKSAEYISKDNYRVETSVLEIAEATNRSITVDSENATFEDVKSGDVILIGNYNGDNREVQSRVIRDWNPETKTATFRKPIITDGSFEVYEPKDLIGREVRIKRIDDFIANYEACIEQMKDYNPAVQIGLIDTGLSNFYSRLLIGYPEKIEEVAVNGGHEHVRVYDYLAEWQYSQKQLPVYLNEAQNTTSDGSTEYNLVNESNVNPMVAPYGKRNFSVKVNGVERYGKDCHIEGSLIGYYLKDTTEAENLSISNWNGRSVSDWKPLENSKVVFTDDVPPSGVKIEVGYSDIKWSSDDCHIGNRPGATLYGDKVFETLKRII